MKYLALIQARCGSSRLPNKVLKDICGKPDIRWVIERVNRSKILDDVMIVTSINTENIPLVHLCTGLGLRVFAGSEDDVLDRYYQAARLLHPEYVVRITGDCPLFDWRYLDDAARIIDSDSNSDYIWMGDNCFPDGLDFEIMTFGALKRSWEKASLKSEREHVTLYIRNHPELFKILVYDFPIGGAGHYRWTLDEQRDLDLISSVYKYYTSMGKEDFVTEDVIRYLGEHPEILELNSGIMRNEGLAKSLREDEIVECIKEGR